MAVSSPLTKSVSANLTFATWLSFRKMSSHREPSHRFHEREQLRLISTVSKGGITLSLIFTHTTLKVFQYRPLHRELDPNDKCFSQLFYTEPVKACHGLSSLQSPFNKGLGTTQLVRKRTFSLRTQKAADRGVPAYVPFLAGQPGMVPRAAV